jgi:uncharacterized protein (PEP-CTERM system associated)
MIPIFAASSWSLLHRVTLFIIVALVIAAVPAVSQASEFKLTPSLTVSEEYNDNIFLYPKKQVTDYITHIIPGIQVLYLAPFWDWDIKYSYEHRYYYKGSITGDNPRDLDLTGNVRLIKEFLFFDVKDRYNRTSLSPVRDYTQVSPTVNQTDQNILTLNPYVVLHPTAHTELKPGYQYRTVWYQDPIAIDKIVYTAYLDIKHDLSERLSLTGTVRREATDTNNVDFTQNLFLIGPRYEYQDASVAWLRVGVSKFTPYAVDQEPRPIWDAGVIHKLPTITLTYETARTWIDDPIFILRREDRYIAGIRKGSTVLEEAVPAGQRTAGDSLTTAPVLKDVGRTSIGGTFGYREYGTGNYVNERRYTTTAFFSHFLGEKVQGTYALAIDAYYRFPERAGNTTTIVYVTDVRFDYHAQETLTYWTSYQYTDSYSPDIYPDNYYVNRVFVGVTASF